MNVTKVRVYPANNYNDKAGYRLVALAAVDLDNQLVITHIRVVQKPDGRFQLYMPSVKNRMGQYTDVAYLTDERIRSMIQGKVLDAVQNEQWSAAVGGTSGD